MLRFCCLGSGSDGNALVVESSDGLFPARVLVDNGFSLRELERRLQRAHLTLDDIDALFVTHEHGDHASGVEMLALQCRLPVFASRGTAAAARRDAVGIDWQPVEAGREVCVGALAVRPYAVPHDAAEPLQFVFSDGDARLGLLTDIGIPTAGVAIELSALDTLLLECNHDAQLLRSSDYPIFVKERIAGGLGHLSNDQASSLLRRIAHRALKRVVAMHLSRRYNRPQLARAALADALGCSSEDILVANQDDGLGWMTA